MAKANKPLSINSSHLTKAEIAERKVAEEKLKGNSDNVYIPPEGMTKKEKEYYLLLVNELKASNILNNLDIEILRLTVESALQMQDAKKWVKKYGSMIVADGKYQKNPAVNIYKDYYQIYINCCTQLGLSPSARAKLAYDSKNKEKDKNDPLLQAIRGENNNDTDS